MSDDPPRRWDDDSDDEDLAVRKVEDLAGLDRWAQHHQHKELTDAIGSTAIDLGAGPMPLRPDYTGRQIVSRRETINGLPVVEYLEQHRDERDQRLVCRGCLTVPPKKHRHFIDLDGEPVPMCGACLHAHPLFEGHASNDRTAWLRKPAAVRRVMLISDFGVDPVTGRRANWHAVETVLDGDGLHESHVATIIQTIRPLGFWDLWRAGKVELRS